MGKRGPKRTPTKLLIARGSPHAATRKNEPQPDPRRPTMPTWLNAHAKSAWKVIVPQLAESGVLTRVDRIAIARYCQTFAKWRAAEEFIEEHGQVGAVLNEEGKVMSYREYPQASLAIRLSEAMLKLEREFGMTPSSRASLTVETQVTTTDKSHFFDKRA